EAVFDPSGKLIAWHHRVVAEAVAGYRAGLTGSAPPPIDTIVIKGSSLPQYPIPNKLVEDIVEAGGARLSSVRGVGVYYNAFAVESFLDEIAKQPGHDPMAFRLERSQARPRVQNLLRAVAEMPEWHKPRGERGLGVAVMEK